MAKVLLVDDDPDVLESLGDWLRRHHEVRLADGFAAALGVLAEGPIPDVVISDYDMPPFRGDDLLAVVAARWPRVCRILHSGTPGMAAAFGCSHIDHVVAKGGDPRDLDVVIEGCRPRVRFA